MTLKRKGKSYIRNQCFLLVYIFSYVTISGHIVFEGVLNFVLCCRRFFHAIVRSDKYLADIFLLKTFSLKSTAKDLRLDCTGDSITMYNILQKDLSFCTVPELATREASWDRWHDDHRQDVKVGPQAAASAPQHSQARKSRGHVTAHKHMTAKQYKKQLKDRGVYSNNEIARKVGVYQHQLTFS